MASSGLIITVKAANRRNCRADRQQDIFNVIPAERRAILLPARNPGEFDSVCYWSRGEESPSMRVSHGIIGRVMREGVAVLSNTVMEDTASN